MTPADLAVEALLADPQRRPAEGWSRRAEAWTEARLALRPFDSLALDRTRRALAASEADALALFTTLEAERAQRRAGGSR